MKTKRSFWTVLFVFLISAAQVNGQSLTDYLFRPASTIFNTLTGGYTSGQGQNTDKSERPPAQSQSATNPPNVYYSTDSPNVRSYQPSQIYGCSNYFAYQRDSSGNLVGIINIRNPSQSRNVLKAQLTVAAQLNSNYYGAVDLAKDKNSAVNDIKNGFLTFRIDFPLQNPLPKLTSVVLNDQPLCSSPKDGGFQTTLMLEYTYTTGLSESYNPQRPSLQQVQQAQQFTQQVQYVPTTRATEKYTQNTRPPVYATQPPVYATQPPVYVTQAPVPIQSFNRFEESDCGVPDYNAPTTTGLILGGRFANRGQFPWLAAFYYSTRAQTSFICGGSLVSSKIVVTAAHCVQGKEEQSVKRPEDATFYLGKHSLETLHEQYFTTSGVSQFIIHQDWRYYDKRYDADIAVAILIRTISFNKFVKPVCLWTASSSYEDLIGRRGIIAGWGKTDYSSIASDKPKWADITVVSNINCLRSNSAFNELTTDRTFCAGERNGVSGPCNGDSGGGLVAQSSNKWYLRGIVSASLIADNICDTSNYAVFTDVQKFNSWIRSFIQNYG